MTTHVNVDDRLQREKDTLLDELRRARDDVEHWASYASEYFQEKWGLTDDLDRIDAVVEAAAVTGRLPETGVQRVLDLDALRAATGGLPPALVAKALAIAAEHRYVELHYAYGLSDDEIATLRAATFEVGPHCAAWGET